MLYLTRTHRRHYDSLTGYSRMFFERFARYDKRWVGAGFRASHTIREWLMQTSLEVRGTPFDFEGWEQWTYEWPIVVDQVSWTTHSPAIVYIYISSYEGQLL